METLVHQSPIELLEGEEVKYTHPNVKVTIKSDHDEVVFVHGTLTLTTARVLYVQTLPRKLCFFFRYQNCVTHGIDKQNLLCMISDLQDNEPEEEDEEEDEANREPDFLLEKLKVVDSHEPEDRVQLVGSYQVLFHYGELGQDKLKDVFQVFSQCSAMNPDDHEQEGDEDMMNNEFITANDIDENGNLKIPGNENEEEFEAEEGGYEDDDEGMGEIMANGQQGSKKQKGEGDMNIE